MKKLILAFLVAFATIGNAQTKLISHKSHSGSNETFALAVENDLFDIGESDFGLWSMEIEDVVKLDSVIYISENKVIRVSSEYTLRYRTGRKQQCTKPELTKIRKDTVVIKPKSVRKGLTIKELKTNSDFLKTYNDTSQTVYNGFDDKSKKEKTKKKKSFVPFTTSNKPNFPSYLLTIAVLSLLSVLVHYLSLKIKSRRMILVN
jgi:hypothetical protein